MSILARVSRFKAGDRVKLAVPNFFFDYKANLGDEGTVISRYGSIYSDPLKRLVWVKWDESQVEEGVYRSNLVKAERFIQI